MAQCGRSRRNSQGSDNWRNIRNIASYWVSGVSFERSLRYSLLTRLERNSPVQSLQPSASWRQESLI